MQSINIITPPDIDTFLPELLEFFKAQHIRYNEADAEDGIITQFLETAIEQFEFYSNGRVVLETGFAEYREEFGANPIELTMAKISAITELGYYNVDDDYTIIYDDTQKLVDFGEDLTGIPALIWLKAGEQWPEVNSTRPRPIVVKYTAGWTDNVLPSDVKTAIFLLATHYYTFRGDEDVDIPEGFIRLARKYHTGNIFI